MRIRPRTTVWALARAPRGTDARGLRLVFCLVALALAGCSDAGRSTPEGATLQVGVARRDITPSAATAPPNGSVYLGGYGFGPERPSTGVLAPIFVRAFVISGGAARSRSPRTRPRGAFAAYKQDPTGTPTSRARSKATGGAIRRERDRRLGPQPRRSGHDRRLRTPDSYLAHLRDQTVGAILDAYAARRDAELWTGTADATDLIRSQFSEPPNDVVDGELRVLRHRSRGGDPALRSDC